MKESLSRKFDIKDMGKLHYFLGMQVVQDQETGDNYIESMQDSKPVSTPADASQKLVKATDEEECINQQQYQSIIGSLMYLSMSSRPAITYSVSTLARYSSRPNQGPH